MASAASATPDTEADAASAEPGKKSGGSRRMLLLAVPLVLAALLAGLWFTGILPGLLGLAHKKAEKDAASAVPIYVDLPVIVANLNTDGGAAKLREAERPAGGQPASRMPTGRVK